MPRYLPESIIIPLLFCNGVTITVLDMFKYFSDIHIHVYEEFT